MPFILHTESIISCSHFTFFVDILNMLRWSKLHPYSVNALTAIYFNCFQGVQVPRPLRHPYFTLLIQYTTVYVCFLQLFVLAL